MSVPVVLCTMKDEFFGSGAKPIPCGKGNCVGRDPIFQGCWETNGVDCEDGSEELSPTSEVFRCYMMFVGLVVCVPV